MRFSIPADLLAKFQLDRERRHRFQKEQAERRLRVLPRIIDSVKGLFSGDANMYAEMAEHAAFQAAVEQAHDAFFLGYCRGPQGSSAATFLAADGRVLHDQGRVTVDAIVEAEEDMAIGALVEAAGQEGYDAHFLELIPPAPQDARPCPSCKGERWVPNPHGFMTKDLCGSCHGRGWSSNA